jgi:HAD superfamily hydrolase (TIGR01509 family)
VRSAVLLDLYGTLVEPDWAALLKGRTALAERLELDAAAMLRAWESTHAARMMGSYGSLADDLAAVIATVSQGRPVSPGQLSKLADDERENWRHGVRLHADALSALSLLRSSGLRLAIVTNASTEAAGVVDDLALRPRVDDVVASCEAGVLKPELLEVALRRQGLEASDATLVDDEPAQLDAASRLGIGTILVRRSGADPSSAATHPVVSDLRQLAGLLLRTEPARRP